MSRASRRWKADYISGNAGIDFTLILEGTEWHKPYQAPPRKSISAKRYRAYKRELDQREKIFRKNRNAIIWEAYIRKRKSPLPRFFRRCCK